MEVGKPWPHTSNSENKETFASTHGKSMCIGGHWSHIWQTTVYTAYRTRKHEKGRECRSVEMPIGTSWSVLKTMVQMFCLPQSASSASRLDSSLVAVSSPLLLTLFLSIRTKIVSRIGIPSRFSSRMLARYPHSELPRRITWPGGRIAESQTLITFLPDEEASLRDNVQHTKILELLAKTVLK